MVASRTSSGRPKARNLSVRFFPNSASSPSRHDCWGARAAQRMTGWGLRLSPSGHGCGRPRLIFPQYRNFRPSCSVIVKPRRCVGHRQHDLALSRLSRGGALLRHCIARSAAGPPLDAHGFAPPYLMPTRKRAPPRALSLVAGQRHVLWVQVGRHGSQRTLVPQR